MGSRSKKNQAWRGVQQALEAWAVRGFLGVIGRLPVGLYGPLARGLSRFARRFLPVRQRVIEQNLCIAFPDRDEAVRGRILTGVYEQAILFALELARLRRASAEEVRRAVQIPPEGQEYLDELLARGGGILVASAHYGNWEWLGAWTALTYGKFGVVYKPMHNPGTEKIAQDLRQRFGIKIFSTRDRVPRALFGHLRAGGMVAILSDQDARRQGKFVPFFGRQASTALGMASLAIRLRVPILAGFCLRTGPGQFRIKLYPTLWPDPTADPEQEELRLMAAYHGYIEDVIRQAPEQYFWLHQRWKTRPPATQESVPLVASISK